MPWKAWLEGHEFDLETLRELFRTGDPLVAQDPSDGYYLESSALQDSDGQLDHSAAEPLVKRINGVARAADQGLIWRECCSILAGSSAGSAFAEVRTVRMKTEANVQSRFVSHGQNTVGRKVAICPNGPPLSIARDRADGRQRLVAFTCTRTW